MSRLKILPQLHIQDMAFGGQGIAKLPTDKGELIVFVEDALPGQIVTAKVLKNKKHYLEAKMLRVEQASELEQTNLPYQAIAGAPLLRLPIETQIKYKEKAGLETLRRLGKWPEVETYYQGYLPSPQTFHYRNKMEYSFSTLVADPQTQTENQGFGLGFKRRGQWKAVENLNTDSGLFDAEWENFLPKLRNYLEQTQLPAWDTSLHRGFFRYLVVRKSQYSQALLINLVVSEQGLEQFDRQAYLDFLLQNYPSPQRLTGLQLSINTSIGDQAKQDGGMIQLYGSDYLVEKVLGLSFQVQMPSFFQPNPTCAARLYQRALDYAQEALASQTDAVALDLFCGTGTLAQLMRRLPQIREVVGVDIVERAIVDAKANAQRNGLEGISFYAADVKDFLREQTQYRGQIHLVMLDPPRGGMVPKALKRILELDAPHLIYISCNPATQARDLLAFREMGYQPKALSFVDQFPHTNHLESVLWLAK